MDHKPRAAARRPARRRTSSVTARSGWSRRRWEDEVLDPALARTPERAPAFRTVSGQPVPLVTGPDELPELDYDAELGDPGRYPYTRGLHRDGYRSRVWTMRQFAGFGTPADTNRRYRQLLADGGAGLSVAFDLPTLMGRDPDHPLALGEVGTCGVSVASVDDMHELFAGIPLTDITTSMTINGPAPMIFAMYLVMAEEQGVDWRALSGTIQNDILKEFIAQKEFIFPPRPSMRLVTDIFAFATVQAPKWNTISVSGYHIREAGSTAVQELAFTLRDGIEYVQWAIDAGLDVDAFAPRMSFFFNAHSDLFEEIAKYRAARNLWARIMRGRFGAKDERSWKLRFHAQTAGVSLTAQQPYNNVVRTALQALSAVLGGASSLHTNSLEEALSLPTDAGATLALRTQQILAYETGVADVVDPFAGSWYLEKLTRDFEDGALRYFDAIDAMGGMVHAIEQGFPQREIADASYAHQQAVERGEFTIVGVNAYTEATRASIPIHPIDQRVGQARAARVRALRQGRDTPRVIAALDALRASAAGRDNTMPAMLDCARVRATVGEMCDALRDVWGEHTETPAI
ncbi:MAG: methylmalonyl-CoA mutase family protein [Acidobacteriota bacterium]